MVTSASPSRRQRVRTAAVEEIKSAARQLLVEGGPAAMTLRAIAREMGVTPSAIYHYFSSLHTLVDALSQDLFDELLTVIEQARAAAPGGDPLARLGSMAYAFRRWALDHPEEFGLVFGPRMPGINDTWAEDEGALAASVRFGEAFLAEFAELWERGSVTTPPPEVIEARLGPSLAAYLARQHEERPLPVVYILLTAWTRLYGLVAMEVFGHLRWALGDAEALFDIELENFVRQLTASGSAARPPRPGA